MRVGGGIDWYVNDRIYVNTGLDYLIGVDSVSDFDYVTAALGVGFRL